MTLANAPRILPAVSEAGRANGKSWIRSQAIIRRNDCGRDCNVTHHDSRRGPRCRYFTWDFCQLIGWLEQGWKIKDDQFD